MSYRTADHAPVSEPTRTVSDWNAFWVGCRGVGLRWLFLLSMLGLGFPLTFLLGVMNGLRYLVFRVVAHGHAQMGIDNTRAFRFYLFGGPRGSAVGFELNPPIFKEGFEFAAAAAWFFSFVMWGGTFGRMIQMNVGVVQDAFGAVVGGLTGALLAAVVIAWVAGEEEKKS